MRGVVEAVLKDSSSVLNILVSSPLPEDLFSSTAMELINRLSELKTLPEVFRTKPTLHRFLLSAAVKRPDLFQVRIADHLNRTSGVLMLEDRQAWNRLIRPLARESLSLYGMPVGFTRSEAYYDISFHFLHLSRAVEEGSTRTLAEAFIRNQDSE